MIARLYAAPAALLILTTLMWASNAVAGQLAVGEITPFAIVLIRWLLVTSVMWPLYGREVIAAWPVIRAKIWLVAMMSIMGFVGFNTLFYIASIHTTGINIGILQGAMPVMILIGAFLAYGDRVRPLQMAGVGMTLMGVLVVATKGDVAILMALAFNQGDLIMALAALFYSVYAVAIRLRPVINGAALFTLFAAISAVVAMPLALWEAFSPDYQWPTIKGLGVTLWIAIFPSCLAQLFFLRGVDLVGPGRAGVYINLVPIFASILAVLLLGEVFALYHAAALALVLGGIWLTERGSPARAKT